MNGQNAYRGRARRDADTQLEPPRRVHRTTVQEKDGMTYINPGSAALPKEDHPKSYMIYENGVFTIKTLTGDVILTHTL